MTPAYNVDYKEISFDVTDVIKEKCTDNLITFTLWTGTGREQVIASKEYSGTDAQGPTLVLEFEGEEPTPTPTNSSANGNTDIKADSDADGSANGNTNIKADSNTDGSAGG